jgi:hypothetical protein
MTNADSALAGALAELAALGTGEDRERIAALRDRLDAARLRVLVAGKAKRGKSTLINALLGCAVLPTGVTPLTAVATTVRYGDDRRVEVRFSDGHEEKQSLTTLPDLVTERGNPGNRRHIAAVTAYLDAPLPEWPLWPWRTVLTEVRSLIWTGARSKRCAPAAATGVPA